MAMKLGRSHVWADLLTETDRSVISNGKYGNPRGLGDHPALLIIDCQQLYIGEDRPIVEQQSRFPAGGGEAAWQAVRNLSRVLAQARRGSIPVMFSRNVQKKTVKFDSFARKSGWDHTRNLEDHPDSRIVAELDPHDGELVIDKSYASAFFATPLISYLVALRVDTLLVGGVSTSGCVRATVVDAITHNFNVAVIEDGVADRIAVSHKVALLDIWMKYADLTTTEGAIEYLQQLESPAS